jgi:hypothetical protein
VRLPATRKWMASSNQRSKTFGVSWSSGNRSRSARMDSAVVAVDQPKPLADSGRVATAQNSTSTLSTDEHGLLAG